MIKATRVCIPLTLDCNLHCRYCYRDIEKLDKIPDFTSDMICYLRNLEPSTCEAVVASGGEPLLYWDKIQEFFSYVPKSVHKKILSNGTLLTQKMVDYINDNEIEFSTSHDGPMTKFLRGADILDNKKIVNLLRQIKILRFYSAITKYNTDVWENFFDIVKRLGRIDIEYEAFPIFVIPSQYELIDGFNYEEWHRTWMQFLVSPYRRKLPWYKGVTVSSKLNYKTGPFFSFNLLPNGTVCGMTGICSNYGSIYNTLGECKERAIKLGYFDYCKNVKCKYFGKCNYKEPCFSEHTRKCRSMVMEFWKPENVKNLRSYVNEHMAEIEQKYGYKKF